MRAGDKLLLGVDLKKPKSIVLPAYNDSKGITAQFNLNLLNRINKELGGDFELDAFRHAPEYSEETGMARSYIQSTKCLSVKIQKPNMSFNFDEGEKIFMEVSRKYDDETIKAITQNTSLTVAKKFYDSRRYFCDVVFVKS